jgi:PhnB protein
MMQTNLHLVFPGTCRAAFVFYESVFEVKQVFTMTFGEMPGGSPMPASASSLIMHTSMPLGSLTLMGCDDPAGNQSSLGGFQISIDSPDETEVRRLFAALSDGGSVQMELGKTFWTALFGMCTDKFGVGWMVSVPGPPI